MCVETMNTVFIGRDLTNAKTNNSFIPLSELDPD